MPLFRGAFFNAAYAAKEEMLAFRLAAGAIYLVRAYLMLKQVGPQPGAIRSHFIIISLRCNISGTFSAFQATVRNHNILLLVC
jgi:hypothetical protein